jgi:hypothetical protein
LPNPSNVAIKATSQANSSAGGNAVLTITSDITLSVATKVCLDINRPSHGRSLPNLQTFFTQFSRLLQLYGPQGPKMTWAQRAKAGVDAKHFQEVLKAKA